MKISCDNCINLHNCNKQKNVNEHCNDWEGNCDHCTIQGEPLYFELCGDCDWDWD